MCFRIHYLFFLFAREYYVILSIIFQNTCIGTTFKSYSKKIKIIEAWGSETGLHSDLSSITHYGIGITTPMGSEGATHHILAQFPHWESKTNSTGDVNLMCDRAQPAVRSPAHPQSFSFPSALKCQALTGCLCPLADYGILVPSVLSGLGDPPTSLTPSHQNFLVLSPALGALPSAHP